MAAGRLRIGYVGVGLMGEPMVRRLVGLGYTVTAYDVAPERMQAARLAGAQPAGSGADAARDVDLVLLNLPTTQAVEDAVFGRSGVAGAVDASKLVIDFSTIPVGKAIAFGARLRSSSGCGWVDAPVSGGPPAAASGSLTVMAGGTGQDLERAAALLGDVSARFTHVGPPGAGLAAKMINQLIVGCGFAVMAEALVLAEASGIDATRLPECLAGGYADSAVLQRVYPRMAQRDFSAQGYARQLLKDLEMVSEFAGALKAPAPMAGQALSLYRMLIHMGYAELDSGAICKLYERPGEAG